MPRPGSASRTATAPVRALLRASVEPVGPGRSPRVVVACRAGPGTTTSTCVDAATRRTRGAARMATARNGRSSRLVLGAEDPRVVPLDDLVVDGMVTFRT